jgi:hypothetical protein
MLHFLNKKIFTLFCISLTLTICGCCNTKSKGTQTQTYEEQQAASNHIYTVSATSAQGLTALNNAADLATDFCSVRNKQSKIIDYKAKYLGLTDSQKKLIGEANKKFGESNSTTSDRDYKATIKFRCVSKDYNNSMFLTPKQMLKQAELEAKS